MDGKSTLQFGGATEPFLQALAGAYRQMPMLAPTIIISDMNTAPTLADGGGHATPPDHAVRDTVKMLGLVDLTADLEAQPSDFPNQTEAAPSCINVCYGHPTTIFRAEARYGPLPLGPTGHRPLHIRLTIPNFPPSPPEDADEGLPAPLKIPPLHDTQAWSHYHRAIDRARRNQPDPTDPSNPICPRQWQHVHFTFSFDGFWVPPDRPWHIPLVYYDANLSHAS